MSTQLRRLVTGFQGQCTAHGTLWILPNYSPLLMSVLELGVRCPYLLDGSVAFIRSASCRRRRPSNTVSGRWLTVVAAGIARGLGDGSLRLVLSARYD